MEPILFSTIEEILPVLDRGVTIDFRHMIDLAVINWVYRNKTRYRIYVRNWIFENIYYKPRPTTELEEQKICIVHELIHALNHLRGIGMPRSKEAKERTEEIIDRHAYTFLDKEAFFERLLTEMLSRDNCDVIFHKHLWINGKVQCPFFYYYFDLLQRLNTHNASTSPVQ